MSILAILNRLLPFATPGTPVLQDVLHLAAICALLYFAPQIQERLQQAQAAPLIDDESTQAQEERDIQRQPERPGGQDVADDDQAGPQFDPHAGGQVDDPAEEVNDHIEEGQAGPARAPIIPEQRNVGAKKAKALARRDQRRAYHEFQRSQGEAQRARDAEGATEREKTQAVERERRKAAETALEAKKAKEREDRRAKEEAARALEQRRREETIELVRSRLDGERMCDLFRVARDVGVEDEEWVERILKASGMMGRRGDTMTMITDAGWALRVSAADMQGLYNDILGDALASDADGRVEAGHIASALQKTLVSGAGD